MKKTVLVLFGGCSSEHDVSLHSAAAVIRAIDETRYEPVLVGITRSGQWLHCAAGANEVEEDRWQEASAVPAILSPSREDHGFWIMAPEGGQTKRVDVVFPVLHGRFGEDGTLQGLLEMAGIPFVGCGCLSSALCMDKEIAHNLALQAGIACPRFVTLQGEAGSEKQLAKQAEEGLAAVPMPWFVKPAAEGSSFGVARVQRPEELAPAIKNALRYGEKIVVEEGISGFEVGCAVLGDKAPETGAVDAISLAGGFFDFHEKYTLETAEILLPAPVDEATGERIKEMALQLYRLFGCKGYARVDMFLTEAGQVIFNEINTIPGMTPHSRYPGMMRAAGMDFEALVARLLEGAVKE